MVKTLLAKDVMNKNFVIMEENDPISKAIDIFDEREPDVIVVVDSNGNYVGILSERWIYRSRLDPTKTKVKTLVRHVPKAYEDTLLVEIARKMIENYVQAVPVFDKDQDTVIGIVSDIDLLVKVVEREFGNEKAMDYATTHLITLLPTDSIGKALATFRDNNISRAPVIDEGKVVGIVTMHDIVTRFLIPRERARRGELKGEKIHPLSAPVSKIMSSPVITVTPGATLRDVVELLKQHDISGVVITDEKGKAIGIITKRDLLEALIKYAEVPEEENYTVQMAGDYDKVDVFEMGHIRKDIESLMELVKKMFDEAMLTVHFKQLKATRPDARRFLIRLRLITPGKVYVAKYEGFNAIDVFEIVKDKLEREIISDKEKEVDLRRKEAHEHLEKYEFWM